jgi:GNAT superfamily N-acetyltransferase
MPGYRFCRSDDIPLLVAAHNACWVPHFGPEQAITVEDFKRGVRELGLWSSSCMVAFDGDEPIGVLIAAKRDREANYVHRLAVEPSHQRQGHGRHLLTSLADKAAILGPPRLVAEIPAESTDVRAFFERSGFVVEAVYRDFVRDAAAVVPTDDRRSSLIVPIAFDELVESGAFDRQLRRPWSRSLASLRARGDSLQGLAVATDRVEAYVVHGPSGDRAGRDVLALGMADGPAGPALLALLLARLQAEGDRLRVVAIAESEVPVALLAGLGFHPERETIGYVFARNG